MISIMIVCILIISVCIHEWAHGYVAYLLGDKTAYYLKRLTLNPFRHIDLVGSIVVPFLLVVTGTQFLFFLYIISLAPFIKVNSFYNFTCYCLLYTLSLIHI